MSSECVDDATTIEDVLENPSLLECAVESLAGSSRRSRQQAARLVSGVAEENPDIVLPYVADLIDALERPEAQTRWECLDALGEIVPHDSSLCVDAIPGAELALFDENSGSLRLAAMRFLCCFGATSPQSSEQVWPLIDEAIQCCHGDTEFQDMLIAVLDFSQGDLSENVKQSLAARMRFDSTNGRGLLRKRAQQIIDNIQ